MRWRIEMAEIKRKLLIPSVPIYILIESKIGERQDGFSDGERISIADLNNEVLEQIADEWKNELIKQAERLRRL